MELNFNPTELRILGCLIEKEMATPEYYPLSLNALTAACNQKSNRAPVMALEETEVVRALDDLRTRGLAMQSSEGVRTPRYRHTLKEKLHLEPEELAVLAELLLRGPQTLGELRTRAERMHPFAGIDAVEEALQELEGRTPALITTLARQPGRREVRHTHLLGRDPEAGAESRDAPQEPARKQVAEENERIASLEAELAALREDVKTLRQEISEFKAQFE